MIYLYTQYIVIFFAIKGSKTEIEKFFKEFKICFGSIVVVDDDDDMMLVRLNLPPTVSLPVSDKEVEYNLDNR